MVSSLQRGSKYFMGKRGFFGKRRCFQKTTPELTLKLTRVTHILHTSLLKEGSPIRPTILLKIIYTKIAGFTTYFFLNDTVINCLSYSILMMLCLMYQQRLEIQKLLSSVQLQTRSQIFPNIRWQSLKKLTTLIIFVKIIQIWNIFVYRVIC